MGARDSKESTMSIKPITVKPLVWYDHPYSYKHTAESIVGEYTVDIVPGEGYYSRHEKQVLKGKLYPTASEAKAAAQSDFEFAILSVLELVQ